MVEKLQQILSRQTLKYCAKCNLRIRNKGKEISNNKRVLLKLVNYSKLYQKTDAAFNTTEVHIFKRTNRTQQNELLQRMLDVCREHTVQQIERIMAEDKYDESAQFSYTYGRNHKRVFVLYRIRISKTVTMYSESLIRFQNIL